VWEFNPRDFSGETQNAISLNVEGVEGKMGVSGCALSLDNSELILTAESSVFVVNIKNKIEKGEHASLKINIPKLCKIRRMHLRDAALVGSRLFVSGHRSDLKGNLGHGVWELTRRPDGTFNECQILAGSPSEFIGWRDGSSDIAFSRPHNIALTSNAKGLLLTDIDNRAVRHVALEGNSKGHVSTILYNEGLWAKVRGLISTHEGLAEPSFFGEVGHAIDHSDAVRICHEKGMRTCSPSELRAYNHSKQQPNRKTALKSYSHEAGNFKIWTSLECHSCWLKNPGKCKPAKATDRASPRSLPAAWGKGIYVLAGIDFHGSPTGFSMQTDCLSGEHKQKGVHAVCCPGNSPEQETP